MHSHRDMITSERTRVALSDAYHLTLFSMGGRISVLLKDFSIFSSKTVSEGSESDMSTQVW